MIRRFLVRGFLFRGVAGAAMVGLGWDERIIRMVRTGQATAKAGPVIEKDLSQAGYSRQQVAELIRLIPLGIITHPVQAGGQPDYQGLPQPDSDADGMPDSWEREHGLNPNDPSDSSADSNGDGYTHIEDFIHGIDPRGRRSIGLISRITWIAAPGEPSWVISTKGDGPEISLHYLSLLSSQSPGCSSRSFAWLIGLARRQLRSEIARAEPLSLRQVLAEASWRLTGEMSQARKWPPVQRST